MLVKKTKSRELALNAFHKTVNAQENPDVTSSRVVAQNALWSILGRFAPMLLALAVTPRLVHVLGPERWGIYTLAIALTGVMGVFDLGVGRALTRTVAFNLGTAEQDSSSEIKTAIYSIGLLGILGSTCLAVVVALWTRQSHFPSVLNNELRVSLLILCCGVPVMLLGTALFGVLSAYQQQRSVNLINGPILILYYAGPLALFTIYPSLIGTILVLLGARALMTLCYWKLCVKLVPNLRTAKASYKALQALLRFGGWLTVSNLTYPLVVYIDRVLMAALLPLSQVGYYNTTNDLATKVLMIPIAANTSAFPAMAASCYSDPAHTVTIFRRTVLATCALTFVPALLIVVFGFEMLRLWLGSSFASHASLVFNLFGLGLVLACSDSASSLLEAIGRPKINALWSVGELLLFVPLLVVGVRYAGLTGGSIAWVCRCFANFFLKQLLVVHFFPLTRGAITDCRRAVFGATLLLLIAEVSSQAVPKTTVVLLAGCTFFFIFLYKFLTRSERKEVFSIAFDSPLLMKFRTRLVRS